MQGISTLPFLLYNSYSEFSYVYKKLLPPLEMCPPHFYMLFFCPCFVPGYSATCGVSMRVGYICTGRVALRGAMWIERGRPWEGSVADYRQPSINWVLIECTFWNSISESPHAQLIFYKWLGLALWNWTMSLLSLNTAFKLVRSLEVLCVFLFVCISWFLPPKHLHW